MRGGGSKYYGHNILPHPRSTVRASVKQGLVKFKATFQPLLFIWHTFLIICCVYAKELMLVENEGGGVKILWP